MGLEQALNAQGNTGEAAKGEGAKPFFGDIKKL